MFATASVLLLLHTVQCHFCMDDPPQRGGIEGSEEADNYICATGGDPKAPCHGYWPECPRGDLDTWIPGATYDVTLNINFGHFQEDNPGNISVYLWEASKEVTGDWSYIGEPLYVFPDEEMEYPWIVTVPITIPTDYSGFYTLNSIYWSNRDPELFMHHSFFTCHDMYIASDDDISLEEAFEVYGHACLSEEESFQADVPEDGEREINPDERPEDADGPAYSHSPGKGEDSEENEDPDAVVSPAAFQDLQFSHDWVWICVVGLVVLWGAIAAYYLNTKGKRTHDQSHVYVQEQPLIDL